MSLYQYESSPNAIDITDQHMDETRTTAMAKIKKVVMMILLDMAQERILLLTAMINLLCVVDTVKVFYRSSWTA